MSRRFVEPDDHEATLEAWRGACAMIWEFSPSPRRLVLRLYRPRDEESLLVVASSCRSIAGPFDWHENQLEIAAETRGDGAWMISDRPAGFELRCGGVGLWLDSVGDAPD